MPRKSIELPELFLITPSDLPLDDLAPGMRPFGDCIHWFLHCLHRGRRASHWKNINYDLMAPYFPGNKYRGLRNWMLDHGLVECDDRYAPGQKSLGYRLTPRYRRRQTCTRLTYRPLIKRVLRLWGTGRPLYHPSHLHIRDCLTQLQFHHPESALARLDGNRLAQAQYCYHLLNQGIVRAKTCAQGRLHHNLTNMPKCLRNCMQVKGETLAQVDISHSQLVFLCQLLRTKQHQYRSDPTRSRVREGNGCVLLDDVPEFSPLGTDLEAFEELVISGEFYSLAGGKKEVFRWLFGNDPRSPVACLVREKYPAVHRMVGRLKVGNHRRLAHRLQRIESRFLFDDVIPRLLVLQPETWLVSIHDSLLVRESDVALARAAFTAAFDDLGMRPKLH